jgi:predicted transcriptional regulator
MSVKRVLDELVKGKAPGPSPEFTVFHLIKALRLISQGPIGRGKLSSEIGIGEGTGRTLIERLKDAELIVSSKKGCFLTEKGKRLWNKIVTVFPRKVRLEKNELTLSHYNIAILVKGCADKVQTGMKQRDASIVVGAEGATTLVMKEGKLTMPAVSENMAQDFPKAHHQIVELLKPKENDVIVIVSADSLEKAEYGAFAAAWSLIEENCS